MLSIGVNKNTGQLKVQCVPMIGTYSGLAVTRVSTEDRVTFPSGVNESGNGSKIGIVYKAFKSGTYGKTFVLFGTDANLLYLPYPMLSGFAIFENYGLWKDLPSCDDGYYSVSASSITPGTYRIPDLPSATGWTVFPYWIQLIESSQEVTLTNNVVPMDIVSIKGDQTAVSATWGIKTNTTAINSALIAGNEIPVDLKRVNNDSTKLVSGNIGVDLRATNNVALINSKIPVNISEVGAVALAGTSVPIDLKSIGTIVGSSIAAGVIPVNSSGTLNVNVEKVGGSATSQIAGIQNVHEAGTAAVNLRQVNNALIGNNVPVTGGGDVNIIAVQGVAIADGKVPTKILNNPYGANYVPKT
ncbi:hypothetical protein [Pedobacter sp. JCM 36344]|uniref:hypothetical protein n=1 Tax=Pedobacter sp. JCM 36344 TaxID=3374280 RepID=UPI00397B44BB